jgi:hypothetical protein
MGSIDYKKRDLNLKKILKNIDGFKNIGEWEDSKDSKDSKDYRVCYAAWSRVPGV